MDARIPDYIKKFCRQEAADDAAQFLKKIEECMTENSEALNEDLRILSRTEYLRNLKELLITSITSPKEAEQVKVKKSHTYENILPEDHKKPFHTCESPPPPEDVQSLHTYENVSQADGDKLPHTYENVSQADDGKLSPTYENLPPLNDVKTMDKHENETRMDVEDDQSDISQVVENTDASQNSEILYSIMTPLSSSVDTDNDIYQSQAQLLQNSGSTSIIPLTCDCRLMLAKKNGELKLQSYKKVVQLTCYCR